MDYTYDDNKEDHFSNFYVRNMVQHVKMFSTCFWNKYNIYVDHIILFSVISNHHDFHYFASNLDQTDDHYVSSNCRIDSTFYRIFIYRLMIDFLSTFDVLFSSYLAQL